MKFNKKHLIYGILAVVFILSILPWLKEGSPVTDDYRHHAMRIYFIQQEISKGQFSEWMPYLYGGWPFFHFYHPIFYILALPATLLFGVIETLKVMTIFAIAVALFGTFYAAKLIFKDEEIALVSAIAYSLSSHFLFHATVAGALPRLTAIAFTPLVMALFIKALEEKTKKLIAISGLSLGILIMLHTSVAIPALVICGILLLYELYQKQDFKTLKNGVIIFVIALCLSAAWLIPLLAEKNYANLGDPPAKIDSPYLEQSLRTFGITHPGEHYLRSNYFGYTKLILALLSLFLIKGNKTVDFMKIGFIASIILYFNMFGILDYSSLIKTALTGSSSFFISTLVFSAAMLAGVGAKSIDKKFNNKYALYFLAIIILIELYPAINAFSYSWVNQPTEDFINPPQVIEAWNFIKNQQGEFTIFSALGQAAEIYHGKNEFGFDWVGCPQCVQKKTYDLHTAIWQNFTKGIKNDEELGFLNVKYYVVSCETKLPNKLVFTNNVACVYENDKFRPIIDSDASIINPVYDLDKITFSVKADKPSPVIIKTNYFEPHWHAYINGKEVQIEKTWPEFMKITVPEGESSVSIEYKTNTTHIVSWFITFLTIILAGYFILK